MAPPATPSLLPLRSASDLMGESGATMMAPSADEYGANFTSSPIARWRSAHGQSLTITSASPDNSATGPA